MSISEKPLIVANWKMNGLKSWANQHLKVIKEEMASNLNCQAVLCPPFSLLDHVSSLIENTPLHLGAQDCSPHISGAYTGDISAEMIKEIGCKYVILGHSERRQGHFETSDLVKNKAQTALENNLKVIICIGETLEQKEEGKTFEVLEKQIRESLPMDIDIEKLIIAYEPIWAIGTGKVASISDITETHRHIYNFLLDKKINKNDEYIKLLYGGSVKFDNIKEILAIDHVDGALIGGASLKSEEFSKIINL